MTVHLRAAPDSARAREAARERSRLVRISLLAAVAAVALVFSPPAAHAQSAEPIAQFAPRDDALATRLDFSVWDQALHWFVLRMGPSLREMASRPEPLMGSHIVFGHDSGWRMEGNRVAFSFMTPEVIQSLTDYRRDLEELPDKVALNRLPRNEQLAYWINLHNVAVIEQIALAYPVSQPASIKLAGSNLPLDETAFITVSGLKLSPKDIRTRIVYPNWHDPKVIYGFWRGEIGGPSISRDAFTGENVGELLADSAREFVNSLRGTQRKGDTLLVSTLYDEARPFFFRDWPQDLRQHLHTYSEGEVSDLIGAAGSVQATLAETDIADLSKGEREPNYSNLVVNGEPKGIRIDGATARFMAERGQKLDKIIRDPMKWGRVIVLPGGEEIKKPEEEVK
jgi:hypothetical protein